MFDILPLKRMALIRTRASTFDFAEFMGKVEFEIYHELLSEVIKPAHEK